MVPALFVEPVAYELLVERLLGLAVLVGLGIPETGGVRGEDLVAEHDAPVRILAELELRVGEDDAAFGGEVRGRAVDRERQMSRRRVSDLVADDLRHACRSRCSRRGLPRPSSPA